VALTGGVLVGRRAHAATVITAKKAGPMIPGVDGTQAGLSGKKTGGCRAPV
jgi:hypothetical protein